MSQNAESRGRMARVLGAMGGLGSVMGTLLGLALVTFLIGRMMPIDPVAAIVGDQASTEVTERVRVELGLDRPLIEQFWIFLTNLAQGDLGDSLMTGKPVTSDILQFFPATLELATIATIIAVALGIPLGVLAAARQGSWVDGLIRISTLLGQSLPIFVLALLSLLIFYDKLGIAPGTGRQDIVFQGMVPHRTGMIVLDSALDGQWDAFWDALAHLAMPAILLAYTSLSVIARLTRTFMLDALGGEYIIAARAKGLSSARILWRHAFANVAGRLSTVIALTYAGLLEGAVLTETIFSWPGLGLYLTRALLNADMNAVLGVTLVVGIIYVVLNLLADAIQRLLDPRVE